MAVSASSAFEITLKWLSGRKTFLGAEVLICNENALPYVSVPEITSLTQLEILIVHNTSLCQRDYLMSTFTIVMSHTSSVTLLFVPAGSTQSPIMSVESLPCLLRIRKV